MSSLYKKIVESIEAKALNEAWSESMPNWLKPRLQATAYYSDRNQRSKVYKRQQRTGEPLSVARMHLAGDNSAFDQADYANTRDGRMGENLFRAFKDAGIDLQNVKFIEGEIPTKKSDPRIQPPNIGIWNIPATKQVYAKGLNDLEKLMSSNALPDSKYINYRFEHLPIKALAEMSDHFCYIDGNSIAKRDINAVQRERIEHSEWEKHNPTEVRQPEYGWGYPLDPSGYPKVPSSERLRKKLEKLKAAKWADKFKETEENLRELHSDIGQVLTQSDWSDVGLSQTIQGALNNYQNAVNDYKSAQVAVETYIARYGKDTDEFLQQINQGYYSPIKRLDEAKYYIDNSRKLINKFVMSPIEF